MQVQKFSLNSDREVIVKIVREELNVFKIRSDPEAPAPEYQSLAVENEGWRPASPGRTAAGHRMDGTAAAYVQEAAGKRTSGRGGSARL